MLSADFALAGGGLLLDGFDAAGDSQLAVSETADAYHFRLAQDGQAESWNAPSTGAPAGATVDGDTLSIEKAALTDGVSIDADPAASLRVRLDGVDFSPLGGSVSIAGAAEIGGSTAVATVAPTAGFVFASAPSGLTLGSLAMSGDLQLTAFGRITDTAGAQIRVDGDAVLTSLTFAGDGGVFLADNATDLFEVTGSVTIDAASGAAAHDISIGGGPGVIGGWTDIGRFNAAGANVALFEDAPTVLGDIDAAQLRIQAAGRIDAAGGAEIDVDGFAELASGAERFRGDFNADGLVDGDDYDVWLAGFGSGPGADRSDGDANADGVVNTADYTLWRDDVGSFNSGGGIAIVDATSFEAGGLTQLTAGDGGSTRFDVVVDEAVEARFGTLAVFGANAVIFEDAGGAADGTELGSIDLLAFNLVSDGPVTDVSGPGQVTAARTVAGFASIDAGSNDVTLDSDAVNFGSVSLLGDDVVLREASGTELIDVRAATLAIESRGPITDATAADIEVAGPASFTARDGTTAQDIALDAPRLDFGSVALVGADVSVAETSSTRIDAIDATRLRLTSIGEITDSAGAAIHVAGEATLVAGLGGADIEIDTAAANFGSLLLGGNDVLIREASSTQLRDVVAASLDVRSQGSIVGLNQGTPQAGSQFNAIQVGGAARLEAVGGDISVIGSAMEPVEFGTLELIGGVVEVAETSSINLAGVNAATLSLTGSGSIVDDPGAVIAVSGAAEFVASGDVTLDNASVNLGTLAVDAQGVTVNEASGTAIARIEADSLTLVSAGRVTDLTDAVTSVAGDASITGATGITLADAGVTNSFVVGGSAAFAVGFGESIDVGVEASGLPADAFFTAGTLTFSAPGGLVRVVEDGATALAASSVAQDLRLASDGPITDTDGASTLVTKTAELAADGGAADVVLGDGSASLSLGAPLAFDASHFLAIAAQNASIQADSSVNLRTGPTDAALGGTLWLEATGNVTQVGQRVGGAELVASLAAQRVAVSAGGAVLLSDVTLTGGDGVTPNLQLKGGMAVDLPATLASFDGLADRFPTEDIPTATETRLSPVAVEADLADGTRPAQPPRIDAQGDADVGLEDVVIAGADGARPSRLAERADPLSLPGTPIDVGDAYSVVARVTGDAIVGAVNDATGAGANDDAARGLVVTTTGNAYLDTTGDLTFSGAGRYGGALASTGASQVDVAAMSGGVLTAVAGLTIRVDTEDPEQPDAVKRTTRLRSATGAVTSLASAERSGEDAEPGPRLLLDPSTEESASATTGLVRADTAFEQRLTLAVGSRGEDNVLIEVEWADVSQVREGSVARPSVRDSFDPARVNGDRPIADLAQAPAAAIESAIAETAATGLQYQELGGGFRVVTVTHNYAEAFVPTNPAQDTLPTTVRVFNDPAINLFDRGGERDLNHASLSIAPRIITVPTAGFFLLSEPDTPASLAEPDSAVPRTTVTAPAARSTLGDERAAVASEAEVVLYGRVDPAVPSGWAEDIPGEEWPQQWPTAEGDFVERVRELIDEGPYSEGDYRVVVQTPSGEQPIDAWTKGDRDDDPNEVADGATDAALLWRIENAEPASEADPADVPREPADGDAPERLPPLERIPVDADAAIPAPGAGAGTTASMAAVAAVAVWRRRLRGDDAATLRARIGEVAGGLGRADRRRRATRRPR